jgi:hypothetical protein
MRNVRLVFYSESHWSSYLNLIYFEIWYLFWLFDTEGSRSRLTSFFMNWHKSSPHVKVPFFIDASRHVPALDVSYHLRLKDLNFVKCFLNVISLYSWSYRKAKLVLVVCSTYFNCNCTAVLRLREYHGMKLTTRYFLNGLTCNWLKRESLLTVSYAQLTFWPISTHIESLGWT